METIELKIKKVLNLRKPQEVAQEINDLETIKSCYSHFLASYESSLNEQAYNDTLNNLESVKKSLKALYNELNEIKGSIRAVVAPKTITVRNIRVSEAEATAITLFNKDKRFTITE